ncbi:zinc-dependent metalloprotease family protein [Streptomyces sp. NBC_00648]|uniref:zinc-dependent metalloprotease family protein n=1 Tax=Streptomyces sp. NBC_00648 TaxID=2975797 RepID=UPI002F915231
MPRPWHLFGAALLAAALTSTALPAAVAATVPADEGATASPGQAGADQIQWPQGSFRALCGARQGAQPDRRTLRLAGGTQVEAVAAKVSRDRQGTLLWAGHVVGRPDLPVILAADNACGSGVPRVAGEVHLGTAEYTIDADQPGVSTVRRLPSHRQASLKDDIRRIAPPVGPAAPRLKPLPRAAVAAPVIDLLIGYTPATVRHTTGGAAALDLKVKASVEGANKAYADSTVSARLNLVGTFATQEWDGDDKDLEGMLSALSDPKDALYSSDFGVGARKMREDKGADLLHVLTQFTPAAGTTYTAGIANTPTLPIPKPATGPSYSTEVQAFGAQQSDTLGTYHLAHEIGHNFGLNHDYHTDPIEPSEEGYQAGNYNPYYPDNHGFLPTDRTWTDIMGYTMACDDEDECETKLWFSNPLQTYDGKPRGVPLGKPGPADCVRVMNLTGPVLAGYRASSTSAVPARYSLTGASSNTDGGTVTPAATGLFDKGDQVTLTAYAKAGYKLDYWAVDGKIQSTRPAAFTVTMDGDHFVTAKFVKSTVALTRLPATITKVSPATGSTKGGYTVTLAGAGLSSTTTVLIGTRTATGFGGLQGNDVKAVDDSTVTFTMPAWQKAEAVQIATAAGRTLTASADFTYVPS